METPWKVNFFVYRKKGNEAPHYDRFELDVNPDEYVIDAIERIWAFKDRSLVYAHACHHSTCGACGMRVNGVEKLTCITYIKDVTKDGGTVRIDPLRNFPVVSDLVVDMGSLFRKMEMVGHYPVISVAVEPAESNLPKQVREEKREFIRLADCIECGLCMSVCPAAGTNEDYFGPAPLAGAHQHGLDGNVSLLNLVDSANGLWRCHSAFECTTVCPSNVDPAGRIMALRRAVMSKRIKSWFGKG